MLKQTAVLGASVAMVGLLGACGGGNGSGAGAPQQPPSTTVAAGGSKVDNPQDASATDLCSLLPPSAAPSLGLEPQGKKDEGDIVDPKAAPGCAWNSSDSMRNVSLSVLNNRSIKEYYDNKSQYKDFGELTIAGHPAVRANEGDPKQDSYCSIFLATKDGQVLHAMSRDSSRTDPCGLAQKALEASIPTLPAAK